MEGQELDSIIFMGAFQIRVLCDYIVLGQWWSVVLQPWVEAVLEKSLSSGCVGKSFGVATTGGGGKGTGKVPGESHGAVGGERT